MLQLIIGARQAHNVIAQKQSHCEVGGLMAKMLESPLKRSQRGDFAPHLRKESQVPFPNVLTRLLLRVGQDRFGLIQEAVSVQQWLPQRRRGLQAFCKQLVQLL
jgi:hypothetical protein